MNDEVVFAIDTWEGQHRVRCPRRQTLLAGRLWIVLAMLFAASGCGSDGGDGGGGDGGGGGEGGGNGGGGGGGESCDITGFESSVTNFSLPAGDYRLPGEGVPCNYERDTDFAYALVDMDGDAKLDLVVTDLCEDDQGVGETHWRVYKSDGDGFFQHGDQLLHPLGWLPPSERRCPVQLRAKYGLCLRPHGHGWGRLARPGGH